MNQVNEKREKPMWKKGICVACGCCVKVCPMSAIQIFHGVMAVVDQGKMCWLRKVCVKACPATVISIWEAAE